MSINTEAPAAPPFVVGQKLRFLGNPSGNTHGPVINGVTHWMEPGMIVTVVEERPGWQGTGQWLPNYEIWDETHDGWSVVEWPFPGGYKSCINPGDEGRWEIVADADAALAKARGEA